MNIVLVHNPKSGSALSEHTLRSKFDEHGIGVKSVICIGDNLAIELKPFLRSSTTICAVGGDGTISAVAAILAGTKAALAPLPGGTLNHFTKDLGVPQDIDEAIASLPSSKVHTVDVGRVNDRVFINNSSIGLYPASVQIRRRLEKYLGKWPAAIVAGVRSFARFRLYTVMVNEKKFRTPFIFVGNNNYSLDLLGGATRSRLNEGILSVMLAKAQSRVALLKIAMFTFIGRAHTLDEFDGMQVRTITIETKKRRISVSRDGEVEHLHAPIRYKLEAGKLRVRH